jgi:hypothetical protein
MEIRSNRVHMGILYLVAGGAVQKISHFSEEKTHFKENFPGLWALFGLPSRQSKSWEDPNLKDLRSPRFHVAEKRIPVHNAGRTRGFMFSGGWRNMRGHREISA